LSSPRKSLTSDSSCPSSVPPLSRPIACEIGDRRDHGAAAGFPPGDSSEFRSTWLVFGQRLGVARPLGWIGQEEFRSLATIFLIGPVAGLVSVGFLRPWGRDVSGPSTQFSGDGFSDMHSTCGSDRQNSSRNGRRTPRTPAGRLAKRFQPSL
jgi:hypothetical protein